MSPWKVIIATVVIFGAGVLTGSFVAQRLLTRPWLRPAPAQEIIGPQPWFVRKEFLNRLDQKLRLAPDQRQRIATILEDSQARSKFLMSWIAPELQEELHQVRTKIRAELTPEQRLIFEEMMQRPRPPRPGEPAREERRSGAPGAPVHNRQATNAPPRLENAPVPVQSY